MGWTRWTPSPGRSSRREPCLDTSPPDPQLSALYQELILDHYRRPRNKGTLDHATHSVSLNNPLCGDEIDLQRSEEHTSELQSQSNLVCRLLLEKKKTEADT